MDGVTVHPEVMAGDGFAYAGAQRDEDRSCTCFGGYVTITVEEDGEEHGGAVPCRRCSGRQSFSR